jgi:predicted DNA-binding transcriptional regulator AlpA
MQEIDIRNLKALDEKAVLQLYKISHQTLNKWVNAGCPRHEFWRGMRRLWRYYQSEINAWLEESRPRKRQAIAEASEVRKRRRHDKYFVNYPLPDEEQKDK